MDQSDDEIQKIVNTFHAPDRAKYPELQEYSRDDLYRDFFGGGTDFIERLLKHLKPGGQ